MPHPQIQRIHSLKSKLIYMHVVSYARACEQVVADGQSRESAEAMAHEIARFPQACMRSDRRSVYLQHGLPLEHALKTEWENSIETLKAEGVAGATRFKSGKGRHGDYENI